MMENEIHYTISVCMEQQVKNSAGASLVLRDDCTPTSGDLSVLGPRSPAALTSPAVSQRSAN